MYEQYLINLELQIADADNSKDVRYDWSQELQGFILSSFFIGNIVSEIPSGILVQKYGAKLIMVHPQFVHKIQMNTDIFWLVYYFCGCVQVLGTVLPAVVVVNLIFLKLVFIGHLDKCTYFSCLQALTPAAVKYGKSIQLELFFQWKTHYFMADLITKVKLLD